jgi:hypothetical protein
MEPLPRTGFIFMAGALLLSTALGGCTDLRRALGMEKVVPDEFAVVSRAPLSVPPDYTLRPPRAGAPRPQEQPASEQARQTIFRAGEQQASLPPPAVQRSAGEGEILREAGAAAAQPNIRDLVNSEATSSGELSTSFVDRLVFWRSSDKSGTPGQVLDAAKEAERLREAKAAGRPIDGGTPAAALDGAPTIEKTPSRSWFGLF